MGRKKLGDGSTIASAGGSVGAENSRPPWRRSKYGATKVVVDGVKFDSKREARRWGELKALESCGKISDLRRQVRYHLDVRGLHICDYIADFTYMSNEKGGADGAGAFVVEDCKGFKTPEYKLKRRLMKACHDIDILEV
jgi:hypothetical protein